MDTRAVQARLAARSLTHSRHRRLPMRVHHYHHFDDATIFRIAREITMRMEKIMATLEDLEAAAEAEDTKIDSLIALTAALKEQVDGALAGVLTPAQQAKVDKIFAAISDNPDRIQAAIDANTTPVEPPVEEPQVEEPPVE